MKRLSTQALKLIRNNGLLYGKIADCLDVAPAYLKKMLDLNNDERLVSAEVIGLIRNHLLDMQDMQLIEDLQAA